MACQHDRPADTISQLSISNGDARIIANVVTRDTTHGWEGGSANAEFIVRAVNTHEALVKALQFIVDGYDNQDVNHIDYRVKVYQVATEALAHLSHQNASEAEGRNAQD